MTMSIVRLTLAALALAAAAQGALAAPSASDETARVASKKPVAAKPLADKDLGDLSGGQAIAVINDQQLKALNTGNSVNALNVTNGPVSLNAGAFSGFSGLGNFVINTGNNNNLQGTMSVNIVMTPSP
jgi:hypothetical protein